MIIVLSPAKTLDFTQAGPEKLYSMPEFGEEAKPIAKKMKTYSAVDLGKLMGISPKLAYLNYDRFQQWSLSESLLEAKQALLAYKGDAYNGLQAQSYSNEDFLWAQDHLRILTGMYGILRPLDLIMPYRLEFATKLKIGRNKDLYDYWKDHLTRSLESLRKLEGSGTLINLASAEYYKALDAEKCGFRVITPIFKEYRNGEYRFLSMFGKKARGMMTSFIIKNRIKNAENIKLFNEDFYTYSEPMSTKTEWVFIRMQK